MTTSPQWNRDGLLANPALGSLRPVLALCPAGRFPDPEDLDALAREGGVTSGGGAPLRFVRAGGSTARGFDSQYEVRIYREGAVPTRPGSYHDLFNALAWLAFPTLKAELNRRHYEELRFRVAAGSRGTARGEGSRGTARGEGLRGTARGEGSRGTARDVLTLFDEGGVIVACGAPELARLLREVEWKALFWSRRAEVTRSMRFFVCGHAIHEKALRPYKGVTAKALIVQVERDFADLPLEAQIAAADELARSHFGRRDALASTRSLTPLPILGVPGWASGNECESFYDDAAVFRPGRTWENEAPLSAGRKNEAPLEAGQENEAPLEAGQENEAPLEAGQENEAPLEAGQENEAPLSAGLEAPILEVPVPWLRRRRGIAP